MKKKKHGLGAFLVFGILLLCFPYQALGKEIQRVETNGTVSFTGVYEPIGTPDPTPPDSNLRPPVIEVAKPGGKLPKTNEIGNSALVWLGALLISVGLHLGWRQRKHNTKLKP